MSKSSDKANVTLGVRMSANTRNRLRARALAEDRKMSYLANRTIIRWMDGRFLEKEIVEANWIEVGATVVAAWKTLDDVDRDLVLGAIPRAAAGNPAQESPKQSSEHKPSTRKKPKDHCR